MKPIKQVRFTPEITVQLASIEPKCCVCGEKEHKKLKNTTIKMQVKKCRIKAPAFLCRSCWDAMGQNNG